MSGRMKASEALAEEAERSYCDPGGPRKGPSSALFGLTAEEQAEEMKDSLLLADEIRQQGNRLYKEGQIAAAELVYTEALKHDPQNHLLYSNRSLCYGKLGRHTLALEDARTVVSIMPTWHKGFARLAAAQEVLGQHAEALKAYEQAAWLAQNRDGDAAAVAEYEEAVERVRKLKHTGVRKDRYDGGW